MSSDNNSGNGGNDPSRGGPKHDKEMQRQLKERKEEMLLFDRFKRVASARLEAMTRQSESSGIKYQMGEEEKQIFRNLNGMGIKEGIAAGVLAFLTLRKGPIYIARWVHQRRLAQHGGQTQQQGAKNPFSSSPSSSSSSSSTNAPPPGADGYQFSNPTNTARNPFQVAMRPDFPRSRNIVIRSIWFAFDSVLSLMLAASVSMAYTDTDQIREQLLELPLVKGRSLTADALCDDIVQELQKVQDEKNPAYQRLQGWNAKHHGNKDHMTPASFYLQGIIAFSQNCQRRRFAEARVRQEQGLSATDPVELPERIPSNAPRLIVASDGLERMEETSSDGTFQDSGFPSDLEWGEVSDFTTDQEEAQSKQRK